MTAKEKAQALMDKFSNISECNDNSLCGYQCKEAAIILTDEILSLHMIQHMGRGWQEPLSEGEYWQEVKKELQKL